MVDQEILRFLTFKLPLSKLLQQELHFDAWFVQFLLSWPSHFFWPFFAILDLCWPSTTLRLTSLKSYLKSFILTDNLYTLINFKIWPFWTFFAIFDLWWLFWPKNKLFWKARVQRFILRYNFSTFEKYWNLTFFGLSQRFLSFDELFDLETIFFGNLTPRASFWGIICLLFGKIRIWPF